jgi:Zn-dependent M28 family amino/carboxypeptidase
MKSRITVIYFLRIPVLFFVISTIAFSCSETDKAQSTKPTRIVSVPSFNADSAYSFVEEQVNFGPRIPNTNAHIAAGDRIINRLESYGAKVTIQPFEATTYDNVLLSLRNIMGSFNLEAKKRILLAAHWDTRPWASKEKEDKTVQFDGANDGGSGVGVLLEIARTIQSFTPPDVGVDLLFFDGEDWGQEGGGKTETWCLGSQYWAKNKGKYSAYYGILLDMVGGKNAQFPYEGISRQMAKKVLTNVWTHASEAGYSRYFIPRKEGSITDDHYYVNKVAKIPMIDILHWEPEHGYFGDWHHTIRDDMSLIDKNTLKAVGQTVLRVVYYEEL